MEMHRAESDQPARERGEYSAYSRVMAYSIPNFLIRYLSDRKVMPSNCAALVLL